MDFDPDDVDVDKGLVKFGVKTGAKVVSKLIDAFAQTKANRLTLEKYLAHVGDLADRIAEGEARQRGQDEDLKGLRHEQEGHGTGLFNLERWRRRLEDEEAKRVLLNLGFEAIREATKERVKMLEHVGIALLDSELPIERLARIERKLRELDSENIIDLWSLSRLVNRGEQDPSMTAAEVLSKTKSEDVLVSTGCVRIRFRGGAGAGNEPMASISDLGRDILVATRTYLEGMHPSFPAPGRDPADDEPSLEESTRTLTETGAGEFVRWAVHDLGYNSHYWLHHDEQQRMLVLWNTTAEREEQLAARLAQLKESLAAVELHVAVEKPDENTTMRSQVRIRGPHHLLRAASELVKAEWH